MFIAFVCRTELVSPSETPGGSYHPHLPPVPPANPIAAIPESRRMVAAFVDARSGLSVCNIGLARSGDPTPPAPPGPSMPAQLDARTDAVIESGSTDNDPGPKEACNGTPSEPRGNLSTLAHSASTATSLGARSSAGGMAEWPTMPPGKASTGRLRKSRSLCSMSVSDQVSLTAKAERSGGGRRRQPITSSSSDAPRSLAGGMSF